MNQSLGMVAVVFLFLYTDDIQRDVDRYKQKGVEVARPLLTTARGSH